MRVSLPRYALGCNGISEQITSQLLCTRITGHLWWMLPGGCTRVLLDRSHDRRFAQVADGTASRVRPCSTHDQRRRNGQPPVRGNPPFYTRFLFLHFNILRKSLSFKHLQLARPTRRANMQGISRRQWGPAAKDAGFSPLPRRQWGPQLKDALSCIIMQDSGPKTSIKGAGTASQRARSRRLCILQIFVPSLRPRSSGSGTSFLTHNS